MGGFLFTIADVNAKALTILLLAVAAILGGLLMLRRGGSGAPQHGTGLDTPKALPALPLIDEKGQPRALNDSGGKLRLVFFGYVRCPDVCPATMAYLSNTYGGLSLEMQEKISVQMVTVDPDFDRPAVLNEYVKNFHSNFIGLTGDQKTINEAAAEMFVGIGLAPVNHDHSEEIAGQAQTAALLHGDQVSVVSEGGDFVRVYNNQAVLNGDLAADLPALLQRYGPN